MNETENTVGSFCMLTPTKSPQLVNSLSTS